VLRVTGVAVTPSQGPKQRDARPLSALHSPYETSTLSSCSSRAALGLALPAASTARRHLPVGRGRCSCVLGQAWLAFGESRGGALLEGSYSIIYCMHFRHVYLHALACVYGSKTPLAGGDSGCGPVFLCRTRDCQRGAPLKPTPKPSGLQSGQIRVYITQSCNTDGR